MLADRAHRDGTGEGETVDAVHAILLNLDKGQFARGRVTREHQHHIAYSTGDIDMLTVRAHRDGLAAQTMDLNLDEG